MTAATTLPGMVCAVGPTVASFSTGIQQIARQVVVNDAGTEIHGYVVARERDRVHVVWAVASGRHRHRTFPIDTVFLPGNDCRWDGYPIPVEQFGVFGQAAR